MKYETEVKLEQTYIFLSGLFDTKQTAHQTFVHLSKHGCEMPPASFIFNSAFLIAALHFPFQTVA